METFHIVVLLEKQEQVIAALVHLKQLIVVRKVVYQEQHVIYIIKVHVQVDGQQQKINIHKSCMFF